MCFNWAGVHKNNWNTLHFTLLAEHWLITKSNLRNDKNLVERLKTEKHIQANVILFY